MCLCECVGSLVFSAGIYREVLESNTVCCPTGVFVSDSRSHFPRDLFCLNIIFDQVVSTSNRQNFAV